MGLCFFRTVQSRCLRLARQAPSLPYEIRFQRLGANLRSGTGRSPGVARRLSGLPERNMDGAAGRARGGRGGRPRTSLPATEGSASEAADVRLPIFDFRFLIFESIQNRQSKIQNERTHRPQPRPPEADQPPRSFRGEFRESRPSADPVGRVAESVERREARGPVGGELHFPQ
jgi:hypothetical protein